MKKPRKARAQGPCMHAPRRIYSWFARDDREPSGKVLCIACLDCGAVLKGAA